MKKTQNHAVATRRVNEDNKTTSNKTTGRRHRGPSVK